MFEYSDPTSVLAAAGGAGGRCLWLWDLAREACVAAVGLDPWGARPGTGWADVAAVSAPPPDACDIPKSLYGCGHTTKSTAN